MANHCTIRGFVPVTEGVTTSDVKAALLDAAKRTHAYFGAVEIERFLADEADDENRIFLECGKVYVAVELRATGGHICPEASALAEALSSLSRESGGWLVLTDHEMSPDSEGGQTLYAVGPTPMSRQVARVRYGMSLAQPFLDAAGVSAKSVEAAQSALIDGIPCVEVQAEAPTP